MRMHPRSLLPALGLALAAGLLASSTALAAGVSVTVSSPSNNANVPLTFNVVASATTSNAGAVVTGWHIYIDSVDKWGTSGPTSSINQSVSTTAGTHTMLVRAWDSTGAFGDQTLTINAVNGVAVNVSSPANGATVPLTFNVVASATTGNSGAVVTGWHIYIDSIDQWGTSGPTSSINQSVSTTSGPHTMLVRAWDSTGAFGDQTLSITGGNGLEPPPGATTVADLDEALTKTDGSDVQKVVDGWTVAAGSCTGACAAKAGSLDAVYSVTNGVASPSRDGSSSKLTISQSPQYTNDLFWLKIGAQDAATHFLSDFWVYPESSMSSAQAMEYDIFQFLGGRNYMWGTQCNLISHRWQADTENGAGWVDLKKPDGTYLTCGTSGSYDTVFAPGAWHHVKWQVERLTDGSNKCRYDALEFDGTVHTLNWDQTSGTTSWHNAGFQFQQDTNVNGTGWVEYIDQAQLSFW